MPMTSDPEARKRSIAALQLWKPGQSGNPNGRTTLGATMNECVNAMKGHTRSEVQSIADDEDRPIEWRAAATRVLGLLEPGWHGHIPLAGNDFDRIMDRTVGKPVQSVMVHHTQPDDPEVLLAELRAALIRSPELISVLGDRVPVEALPAVDTTAEASETVE